MWREIVEKFGFHCTFSPPVQQEEIDAVEAQLSVELPSDLKELLFESNGILGPDGQHLIWPADKLCFENLEMFRDFPNYYELCMPFDNMLFFAGNLNDTCQAYGYSIKQSGIILMSYIYRWDLDTDSRNWVALNLENYINLKLLSILK